MSSRTDIDDFVAVQSGGISTCEAADENLVMLGADSGVIFSVYYRKVGFGLLPGSSFNLYTQKFTT